MAKLHHPPLMQFGIFYKYFSHIHLSTKIETKTETKMKRLKILLLLMETQNIGNHRFCGSYSLSSMEEEEKRLGFLRPWKIECGFNLLRTYLVGHFKHSFSVFKQHYTHFYTFFHPHIFQKIINNIT